MTPQTPQNTTQPQETPPSPIHGPPLGYYGPDFEPSPMLAEAMAEIEADGHGKRPHGGWVARWELADDEHRNIAAALGYSAFGCPAGSKWHVKVAVTTMPPQCIIDPENEDWPWMAERFRVVHDRVRGEVEAEYHCTAL